MTIRLGHIKERCRICKNEYNYGHLLKVISLGKNKIMGYICINCFPDRRRKLNTQNENKENK